MELQLQRSSQNTGFVRDDAEAEHWDVASVADLGPAPLPPDWSSYKLLQSHVCGPRRELNPESNATGAETGAGQMDIVENSRTVVDDDALVLQRCHEVTASLDDAETAFANALMTLLKANHADSNDGPPAYALQTLAQSVDPSKNKDGATAKAALLAVMNTEAQRLSKDTFAGGSPTMQEVAQDATDKQHAAQIRKHVETIAQSWQSVRDYDAELARLLAVLLSCTDRLQTLYADTPSLAVISTGMGSSPGLNLSDLQSDVYSKLELQAKSVKSSRLARQESNESGTSAHGVRAIEEAELELLWSRLSDLLTNLRRLQANAPHVQLSTVESTPQADIDDDDSFERQNTLPGYSSPSPPQYDHGAAVAKAIDSRNAAPMLNEPVRRTSFSAVADEKLQVDLDRMTAAIERLYVASPQLANQRVEAARSGSAIIVSNEVRQRLREAQLAKLGAAIDRLGRGRMEDQRASLSGADEDQEVDVVGSKNTWSWKGKHKQRVGKSLGILLDNIDRAASSSMNDRRVAMSTRQQKAVRQAQSTAYIVAESSRFPRLESEEVAFHEHLLDSVRKGRMTSQDASFTHQPARSGRRCETAEQTSFRNSSTTKSWSGDTANRTLETLDIATHRARSTSIGTSAQPDPFDNRSTPPSDTESQSSNAGKKRFSITGLLSGGIENLRAPITHAPGRSSPPVAQALSSGSEQRIRWIAEGMSGLSTVLIRAWLAPPHVHTPTEFSPSVAHDAAPAFMLELDTEAKAVLHVFDTQSAPVRLPELIGESRTRKVMDMQRGGDHFEVRLAMAQKRKGHSGDDTYRSDAPYPAAAFRTHRPKMLFCVACGAELVALTSINSFHDLPAENWTDMLDAWMCHSDQKLSQNLIDKGNNIWPSLNQMYIRSSSILVSDSHLRSVATAANIEAEHRPDGYWYFVQCTVCKVPVGRVTAQASATGAHIAAVWKFSVYPDTGSGMPSNSLAAHVTSYLLETSLASAMHHFVIQDIETGQGRLVLWLFNPLVRLSADPLARPIETCKLLYFAAEINSIISDERTEALIGSAGSETYTQQCTQQVNNTSDNGRLAGSIAIALESYYRKWESVGLTVARIMAGMRRAVIGDQAEHLNLKITCKAFIALSS